MSSILPCYLGHFYIVGRGWQYPYLVLLGLIGVERIPYFDSNCLTLRPLLIRGSEIRMLNRSDNKREI